MAVLGPGTGFGLGALVRGRRGDTVLVTEGGHASMPAETDREAAVLARLRQDHTHVSIERVLSGPGLVALYEALATLEDLSAPDRTGPEIVDRAVAGDCPASRRALEMFCAFLGGVAGDVALTLGATGGVFVAGGIAPRITEFLRESPFRARFEAKGRLSQWLAPIPAAVIVHPFPAFVGLARFLRAARTG
jgi:glucokinase